MNIIEFDKIVSKRIDLMRDLHPDSIFCGQLGVSVLQLLRYGISVDSEPDEQLLKYIQFYKDALSEYRTWNNFSFLYGSLGFLWSLKVLSDLEIVEFEHDIKRLTTQALSNYALSYRNMPFQYNNRDEIYPIGIMMLPFYSMEDNVSNYYWTECIIHRVRDCEKIVTEKVSFMHNPSSLSTSQLHSILFFMIEQRRKKIFPVKADTIIEQIRRLTAEKDSQELANTYVLDCLIAEATDSSDNLVVPNKFDFSHLGIIGFFSFVYKRPQMFRTVMESFCIHNKIKEEDIISLRNETLIGLSFGNMSIKYYADED